MEINNNVHIIPAYYIYILYYINVKLLHGRKRSNTSNTNTT